MSKHTPGTWSIPHFADENSKCACSYIFSETQHGFGSVATVQFGGEDEPYDIAKANANLIAAAPDLLEALELLLLTRTQERHLQGLRRGESPLHDRCHDAIAKAKGESQ
jgi:hypothetical protein